MKSLDGKVVVITGAASGIGRALAVRSAAERVRLALLDRDEAGLSETAAICRRGASEVEVLRVDVSQRPEVETAAQRVIERFGCVDVVINNAGVSSAGRIQELTYETLRWTLDTNLWGVVHGTMAFLPYLLQRTEANLVNLSSVFGLIGWPGQAAYCASKFAVRGFSEAVRLDLRGTPVAVTVVMPTGVQTQIARNLRADSTLPPEEVERIRERLEASFRTSADEAAEMILRGVRRNAPRVLVGGDARKIDLLARLRPDSYDTIVVRRAARLMS